MTLRRFASTGSQFMPTRLQSELAICKCIDLLIGTRVPMLKARVATQVSISPCKTSTQLAQAGGLAEMQM